ncbi:MAG TPA: CoA pyrophosphatase [Desulfuromonadales bacterium]|nr:CoA pyrophosphatase [Desulfuromonadales bacterium]
MLDRSFVRQRLETHAARSLEKKGLRPAAVLLLLFVKQGRDHLLLTRRTDHLDKHAGEVSFPGGGRHSEDHDLLATALRETEEEVGIDPSDVETLGRLDDIISIHDVCVTPFVGAFPYPYPFAPCDFEIAEILELPLDAFLDPEIFRCENWRFQGRTDSVCFFTVEGHEVWGLTAAILVQFLQRLGIGHFRT